LPIRVSDIGVSEYSSLLGCDDMSTAKRVPTFRKENSVFIFGPTLLGQLGRNVEGSEILRIIEKCLPNNHLNITEDFDINFY
jgi:hypothetical protein